MLIQYYKVPKYVKEKTTHSRYIQKFFSKALYGTLVVTALIVAMEDHHESAGQVILNLLATVIAFALAEFYSDIVAERLIEREKLTRKKIRIIFYEILPISVGSHIPTLIFFLALFGLISIEQAFFWAKVAGLITLFGYGYLIGKLGRKSRFRCFINGVINVLIGGFVILVKAVVH